MLILIILMFVNSSILTKMDINCITVDWGNFLKIQIMVINTLNRRLLKEILNAGTQDSKAVLIPLALIFLP